MGILRLAKFLSVVLLFASVGASAGEPVPVAFTLSGGVSLGAYQAGSLYYSSLVMNANPQLFKTRLLTGASAGALNAVHTILSVCGGETDRPSESAFYKTWVGFHAADLLSNLKNASSLFSRDAFQTIASELEAKWFAGLPNACDVVVGFSVTRLQAKKDKSQIGFARQGEKITLRIRGRGAGRAPLITNYLNPLHFPKPLSLELVSGDDRQNFDALKSVLFATSAFPIAFAPQTLRTRIGDAEVEASDFIDGGLFDNKPLALAEKLARTGLVTGDGGAATWREMPDVANSQASAARSVLYFYSDLGAKTYGDEPSVSQSPALAVASMLAGNILRSSRNEDAASLFEQAPEFENQVASMKNGIPRMGDSLLGFSGFFERDFRSFDFFLGLWETREFIDASLRGTLRIGGQPVASSIRLPVLAPNSLDALKLECLDATFKERRDAGFVCDQIAVRLGKSGDLRDQQFAILARLALSRAKQRRGDFRFVVETLAKERYVYRDLGLTAGQAWRAPARIKTEAIRAISNLASNQPAPESIVFRAAGPVALNLVEPLPIENDLAITVGPQPAFTFSSLMDQNLSFRSRWYLGAGFENLNVAMGSASGRVVVTPFTGLEFEPERFQTTLLQTRFSAGVGYKEDTPTTRLGLSLTLLERVRVQADFEAKPFKEKGPLQWQVLPSLGLQFYF